MLVGKTLQACYLNDEGVTVLDITRDDETYVGAPRLTTEIYPGDRLLLYGRAEQLRDLDTRRADSRGNQSHTRAVDKQADFMRRQDRQESEHTRRRHAGRH